MDHKQYLHCNYGSPDPGLPQAELSCAYDASGSLASKSNSLSIPPTNFKKGCVKK